MSEQSDGKIIFQEGDITITNTRVTLEGHTTLTANIVSAETVKNTKRGGAPILLGFFSIVAISGGIALMGSSDNYGWIPLAAGAISLTAAIYLAVITKAEYFVKITTTSGEFNAIGSADKDFVDTITEAVEAAVVERKAGLSGEAKG